MQANLQGQKARQLVVLEGKLLCSFVSIVPTVSGVYTYVEI